LKGKENDDFKNKREEKIMGMKEFMDNCKEQYMDEGNLDKISETPKQIVDAPEKECPTCAKIRELLK